METLPITSFEEFKLTFGRAASREGIVHVEGMLRAMGGDGERSDTFHLVHRFANSVYAREITLPAGSLVVGKIHKHGHLNVITKGRVAVVTEDGVEEFLAPHTFISKAGTKRLVFAFEETVWTTFHGTELTDPTQVEEEIICKTFADFDALQAQCGQLLEDRS